MIKAWQANSIFINERDILNVPIQSYSYLLGSEEQAEWTSCTVTWICQAQLLAP